MNSIIKLKARVKGSVTLSAGGDFPEVSVCCLFGDSALLGWQNIARSFREVGNSGFPS